MTEYPVVLCEPYGPNRRRVWRFWCEHCRCHHSHGAQAGHRVAHCHTEAGKTAYPHGYVLKLDPLYRKRIRWTRTASFLVR
jgi:hypothetical protein